MGWSLTAVSPTVDEVELVVVPFEAALALASVTCQVTVKLVRLLLSVGSSLVLAYFTPRKAAW